MNIQLPTIPNVRDKGVWAILRGRLLSPNTIYTYNICTLALSTLTRGFFMSIKAAIDPFKTASIIFPASLITIQSIVICHTNLPVRMHRDSGSNELLPTINFYSSFVNSFAFFLFWSNEYGHAMQLTLKNTKP